MITIYWELYNQILTRAQTIEKQKQNKQKLNNNKNGKITKQLYQNKRTFRI